MTQRENGRTRYRRQVREIQEELGISYNDARRRWRSFYALGGRLIKPIKHIQLSVRAAVSGSRQCCFCRDDVVQGYGDHTCRCGASYHHDCFFQDLQGSCATIGCAVRRVHVRIREQAEDLHQVPTAWDVIRQLVVAYATVLGFAAVLGAVVVAIVVLCLR